MRASVNKLYLMQYCIFISFGVQPCTPGALMLRIRVQVNCRACYCVTKTEDTLKLTRIFGIYTIQYHFPFIDIQVLLKHYKFQLNLISETSQKNHRKT